METIYTKKATWLGRAGELTEIRLERSAMGKRVCVLRWLDNGDVKISAVNGDGRTPNFNIYSSVLLANATPQQINAAVDEAVAAIKQA